MGSLTTGLIRLGTALIPFAHVRKRVRRRLLDRARDAMIERTLPRVRARYAGHEARCASKLARGERLGVCFLVSDVAQFSAEPVYLRMRGDPRFDAFIAVAPRVSRGEDFLRETQEKTLRVLTERYGEVLRLYDPETGRRASLANRADIVFTSIVYRDQTLEEYTVESLSEFALVACIPYGYSGLFKSNVTRTVFLPEITLMWRYFFSNRPTLELWTGRNRHLADSARLSGYAKMDRLADVPVRTDRPKTVVIAPHHSLPRSGNAEGLTLSTFLIHSDLFLQLPREYPGVRFVFRPHPLLFPRLATDAWWGAARTQSYRAAMASLPNVEFQQGGDYFETFANSDALIHDCGSFLAEYFYTGRPQCYLLADRETEEREFLPFGRRLLDHTYKAYDARAVREFLDRVVLGGDDPMKGARDALAESDVRCFYPHAADRVVDAVVESILGNK